jgi:hypothetical protein
MNVFVVVTVARQVEGDYIAIKFEKAFSQASKADTYMAQNQKVWTENLMIDDAMGHKVSMDCLCERGVHQLEVEE